MNVAVFHVRTVDLVLTLLTSISARVKLVMQGTNVKLVSFTIGKLIFKFNIYYKL